MQHTNSGNERIKEMAHEFHNNNVMEMQETHFQETSQKAGIDLESIRKQLNKYGLRLLKEHGGFRISEIDESPLKPGWVELPKFANKHGYNESKIRLLIKDAPEAIKRRIGRSWVVNEEFFEAYVKSCYKQTWKR